MLNQPEQQVQNYIIALRKFRNLLPWTTHFLVPFQALHLNIG